MRYLHLAFLLAACGSDPSPAAVDAARLDVLGVDVATDVTAVVDAAADTISDVTQTPDATPDAAVVDVAVDAADAADVAVDVATDSPFDAPVTMPSQSDRVGIPQVWLSINGGPFERDPAGSCSRRYPSFAVTIRARVGAVSVMPTGARGSVMLQCPGAIDDAFQGIAHTTFRDSFGAISSTNTGAGLSLVPPSACGDSPEVVARFELRAFGCPTSP